MTTFRGSPRTDKAALVGIDPLNPVASIIVFQYNPDTLTRSLQAQGPGGQAGRSEPTRLTGAPVETIQLEAVIDATDQMETGDETTAALGIYPQLSALEVLLYPKTAQVIANTALLLAGTIEVVPPAGPFTLFIWGPKRVLPVRLSDFAVTEEAYDPALNPIRARVTLGLRVLSYNDFSPTHPGHALFLAHQVTKEAMAVIGSAGSVNGAISASLNTGG